MSKRLRTNMADKNKVKRVSTTTKRKRLGVGEKIKLERKTRSGLESRTLDLLDKYGVEFDYEPKEKRVSYTVPSKDSKYLPDIVIGNYYFELKGYISDLSTRMKYLYIHEQNPDINLVMVFQKPTLPIRKGSKTTYREWFEGKGITCLDLKQFDNLMKEYKKTGKINIRNEQR